MLVESDTPKLLRVDQVARRLGCSQQTVRRRISTGELAAVRLGNGPKAPVRVPADELERFVYGPPRQPPEPGGEALQLPPPRSERAA
jgi:excisionase family DNA binding protein